MSLINLNSKDKEIIFGCIRCVSNGKVILHDWEFELLMGITPNQLKIINNSLPNIDDSNEVVQLAINNSMNNLLSYPHARHHRWNEFIPVSKSEIERVFTLWKEDIEIK